MKFIILCVSLIAVALATTDFHPRGCIYALGKCVRDCEVGTHAYTTGCGPLTPEATCDNPQPKADTRAMICDYSSCYCDPPTVRDTVSKKCIPLDECPK